MIPEVARLWFHSTTYIWENKHQGGYSIKKGSSRHARWQQGCLDTQGRIMDKKNNSRDNDVEEKQDNREFWSIGRNMKK